MYVHEFPPRPDIEQYRKQAKDLLRACQSGDTTAQARMEGVTNPDDPIHLADAQRTLAREHGFASWPGFVRHVAGLAGERTDAIGRFERAADAVVEGDPATLTRLLDHDPSLITTRSSRQHRATLLHYVSANGVEDFRQRSPHNAPAIAELLLARGAVVDAVCESYEGDDTTMGLLVSSVHPHHAGVQVSLVQTILDHGAAVDGIADDCSNLLTALAFQYPRAAEALEQRGARVDNILAAAGLGRLDLVRRYAETAPLRLPKWLRPVLPLKARALLWAAALDRREVADFLSSERDLLRAADNQGFTALHWAAFNGHADMVDLLIRKGADLQARNTYGGTVLGGTLWSVANNDQTIDRTAVVRRLLAAGAALDDQPTRTGNADIDALLAVGESAHPAGGRTRTPGTDEPARRLSRYVIVLTTFRRMLECWPQTEPLPRAPIRVKRCAPAVRTGSAEHPDRNARETKSRRSLEWRSPQIRGPVGGIDSAGVGAPDDHPGRSVDQGCFHEPDVVRRGQGRRCRASGHAAPGGLAGGAPSRHADRGRRRVRRPQGPRHRCAALASGRANDSYTRLDVVDLRGQSVASSRSGTLADPSRQDWFRSAVSGKAIMTSLARQGDHIEWIIAQPVLGSDGGVRGVVVGELSPAVLPILLDPNWTAVRN